ncbi:hypothetical protein RSAG8_05970, partial [Rhizoctonia solani AG-8 WAC10335]
MRTAVHQRTKQKLRRLPQPRSTATDFKNHGRPLHRLQEPRSSPVSQPAQTKVYTTSSKREHETTDPTPGCGGTIVAQPGANPEQEESEYPTPKATTSVLPKAVKNDEHGDAVDSLVGKLSGTTLEDTNDSSGPLGLTIELVQAKPGEPEGSSPGGSVSSPPPCRGERDLHHFCTPNGWYYFDDYRNVFFEDGALVHDGNFESSERFDIDGVWYWFIPDGLLYQDAGGAFYRVPTSAVGSEQNPNQLDPIQAPDGLQGPQDDTDALQPSLGNELDCDSHSAPPTTSNSFLGRDTDGLADLLTSNHLVEDSIDLNGGINHGLGTNQPSITSTDYFHTPRGVHCFDDDRKLYSEDGKLVYDGSSSLQAYDSRFPNFYIGGSAYWFDKKGLSRRDADGTLGHVRTWQIDPSGPLDQLPAYQDDVAAIQPGLNPESSSKPKAEVSSPDSRSDSLQNGFQKGLVSMSPGSSRSSETHSPNIDTITNPSQLFGDLSLFLASEPGYPQSAQIVSRQQLNTINVQNPTEKVQPARKRNGNKNHLRCPYCGKECRRPGSLSEHIRVHTREKTEICPFENCTTGFATKSNMRRHFATHRVGTLEEYVLEAAQQPSGMQSGKVTCVPTLSHNRHHPWMSHH